MVRTPSFSCAADQEPLETMNIGGNYAPREALPLNANISCSLPSFIVEPLSSVAVFVHF